MRHSWMIGHLVLFHSIMTDDLVFCIVIVTRDVEYPYWDQGSLNNINILKLLYLPNKSWYKCHLIL